MNTEAAPVRIISNVIERAMTSRGASDPSGW